MRKLLCIVAGLLMALPVSASQEKPGEGVTVKPARATWDTGYFQEALVRAGLKELGYTVKNPKDLQNILFYQSVALGDVDYWANGWFPIHNSQMPKDFFERASIVGCIIKAGGVQGYLASKDAVEKYAITSLEDFKRPEVKAAFDNSNNGKADLVGCPPGWGCNETISFHMDVYALNEHINTTTAGYAASIADVLARHRAGKPVLFYSWAPSWTIHKMKPGKDVVWLNVPDIKPREAQKSAVDRMTASDVEGAVTDPVKLGFIVADVQMVANNAFLASNPAAKRFFELFKVSLADVSAQNTLMQEGEKSQRNVERHAQEWIAEHRDQWDHWLEEARKAAISTNG